MQTDEFRDNILIDNFKMLLLEDNYLSYLDELNKQNKDNLRIDVDKNHSLIMSKNESYYYMWNKAIMYSLIVFYKIINIKFVVLNSGTVILLANSYYTIHHILTEDIVIEGFNYNELKSFESLAEKIVETIKCSGRYSELLKNIHDHETANMMICFDQPNRKYRESFNEILNELKSKAITEPIIISAQKRSDQTIFVEHDDLFKDIINKYS